MNRDARRLKALLRLKRLRAIETMTVQRELAEARQFQNDSRGLQMRSADLAKGYSARRDQVHGAALAQSLGLAGELAKVSQSAKHDVATAENQIERSSQKIAQLDHQQERIDENIAEARRAIEARVQRSDADTPRLARHLLK